MDTASSKSLSVVSNHIPVKAAADYSGYSVQCLRRLLRSGKLGGLKIGQIWLIEINGIDNLRRKAKINDDRRLGPRE